MSSVSVCRVRRREFAEVAARLASVYVECFASAPWSEVFLEHEVIQRVETVLDFDDSVLLIARSAEQVLGATMHYPLRYNAEVLQTVGQAHADAMYCEELFVTASCQRRGVGGRLFDVATGMAMAMGYATHVLRTASDYDQALRFYGARGYRRVGQMQCRSRKRNGGSVQSVVESRVVLVSEPQQTRGLM